MTLLEIRQLLQKHRILPNKSMGQNFTVDASVYNRMLDYAALNRNDIVLDIGAGFGFLTREAARLCRKVFAVEADRKIAKVLRERLGDLSNVIVIQGNVLGMEMPHVDKVVSIPPYNISSKLLSWLLKHDFKCAVVVFQKEFAEKLLPRVGTREYNWLAVMAYYYAEIELLDVIPSAAFYPEPEVDSTIVRMDPKLKKPFVLSDERCFESLTRALFTNRNRKVRNAAASYLKKEHKMNAEKQKGTVSSIPFADRRVRELTPEDFGVLANELC